MKSIKIPAGTGYYKIMKIPISGGNYPSDACFKCTSIIELILYRDRPYIYTFSIVVWSDIEIEIERIDFSNRKSADNLIAWKISEDGKSFEIYVNPFSNNMIANIISPVSLDGTGAITLQPLAIDTTVTDNDLTTYTHNYLLDIDVNSTIKNAKIENIEEYTIVVNGANPTVLLPNKNRIIMECTYIGQDEQFLQCTILKNAQGIFSRYQYEADDQHLQYIISNDTAKFSIASYGILHIKCISMDI